MGRTWGKYHLAATNRSSCPCIFFLFSLFSDFYWFLCEKKMEQANGQILNIPQYLNQRPSTDQEESDLDHMETESHTESTTEEPEEGSIGENDDGKTGKLTLAILLHENLIQAGEKIRSIETGLIFNNPSAWAIYCKKIINPAKKSGCGWASVKYKGRKMDYYKSVWTKRKAQRDAENAKNEAAQ